MVPDATLTKTDEGLVPEGDGWFVLNAREARWAEMDGFDSWVRFEGEPRFPDIAFRLTVLHPGQPNCMYHGESDQEDFLVLSGECTLVIEGEERRLTAWDFVHCPPWTEHAFVGAGDTPCVIVMVGARTPRGGIVYPVNDVAAKHGASVEAETRDGDEAYARFPDPKRARYEDGWLP
jgi:uncharacterized cupin superfamily protein